VPLDFREWRRGRFGARELVLSSCTEEEEDVVTELEGEVEEGRVIGGCEVDIVCMCVCVCVCVCGVKGSTA
jgi:hypothetical protein